VSSNKPDDASSHINSAEKSLGQFVIAGGNGSVLFEFGKEILNQVTGLVQISVILPGRLAVAFGRNDRRFTLRFERFNHPFVSVIALIGEHCVGGNIGQQDIGPIEVTGLSGRQMKPRRMA
jgi:hypothetical protein